MKLNLNRCIYNLGVLLYNEGFMGFIKTLYFNFKYIQYPTCFKLPVFISKNTKIQHCHRGFYEGTDKTGTLYFRNKEHFSYKRPSLLNIKGKIRVKGQGFHSFGPGLILTIGKNGVLEIGNNFTVEYNSKFHIYKLLKIGEDNMWSHDIVIRDTDGHKIFDAKGELINPNREIRIDNHVWIGYHSRIYKGVHIPDGCVIGANSIITKSISETNSIVIGNGIIKRKNITWKRDSLELSI